MTLRVRLLGGSATARHEIRAILEEAGIAIADDGASFDREPPASMPAVSILAGDEEGEIPASAEAGESGATERATLIEPLTARELQVLELVAEGQSNREVAERLAISHHTVKFHLAAIYGKLGVTTRAELVRTGIRFGLIAL